MFAHATTRLKLAVIRCQPSKIPLQQHILTILDSAGTPIADTRQLSYPDGRAADPEECGSTEYQLSIKSALDSLVGKEVNNMLTITQYVVIDNFIHTDGNLSNP